MSSLVDARMHATAVGAPRHQHHALDARRCFYRSREMARHGSTL
jgi:hypothetical protein